MALVSSNNGNSKAASDATLSMRDTGTAGSGSGGNVSLGKGAWDCDFGRMIPADKEAEVFEEIANMDMDYEGIPTVPMRKDMDHMVGIPIIHQEMHSVSDK